MKTVLINKPFEIAVTDTPKPEVKEGEALLKILYCGICGADVASYTGNQPFTTYPRIPGHEFSAEIVSIPENDRGLKPGDVVTANPYFNCGECYSCRRGFVNCCTDNKTMGVQRDGSFCEYVAMPVERIYEGKGLSAKELALVEPFTISYHAVNRAPVKAGDKVLVVGAGPIGLFALIAAINKGAEVYVADILDGRLEKALDFGAKGVINSAKTDIKEEAMKITGGDGFDCCIEACGQSVTFLNCIDCCAFAGKIILIGNGKKETTFLHSILLKKELNVYGSRNSYPSDFKDVIDLISSGKVDVLKMVSDIYPMDRADEAFKALANNKGDLCKVLVKIGD
ncbi:MAG TPA: zinc-binding alcohol dehydrogenase family protein [Candidatus Faeciplasma pullistercoris]|uniref:Zinc-binding alcohol dehydrogenase family protein n=1 Tax=Candidatus Faeciplasma pullistercoris TaxID=2840800 RepID=A0A9D1KJU6_9FIRM|nr:zinc-binding alcohol dehydrogenase family protein [Candidatus Faeciplasma pullistercoris]